MESKEAKMIEVMKKSGDSFKIKLAELFEAASQPERIRLRQVYVSLFLEASKIADGLWPEGGEDDR